MITIVLLGLLACASAAPKRGCHHHHHHYRRGHSHYEDDSNSDEYSDRNIESQMFDTRRLWSELSRQIMRLDTKLSDFSKRFNRNEESSQIHDKEYKIFIQLHGFLEKEILIKEENGLLFVQAIRKVVGEPDREYLNVMTLPHNVGENLSWTYQNGLLKIVFPITQFEKEIPTQMAVPDQSMQLIGQDNGQNENIFETNGDLIETNKQGFETNKTPGHENTLDAASYAVDLNDDTQLV